MNPVAISQPRPAPVNYAAMSKSELIDIIETQKQVIARFRRIAALSNKKLAPGEKLAWNVAQPLIANGKPNAQGLVRLPIDDVAKEIGMSDDTVGRYFTNMCERFGATHETEPYTKKSGQKCNLTYVDPTDPLWIAPEEVPLQPEQERKINGNECPRCHSSTWSVKKRTLTSQEVGECSTCGKRKVYPVVVENTPLEVMDYEPPPKGAQAEELPAEEAKPEQLPLLTSVVRPAIEELREFAQWVCWRYGAVDLKTGKKKKIPINPRTSANADHGDPLTWAFYDEALTFRASARVCDGIGFVFHNDYTGIDLDECRDKETGEIEEWAWNIIRTFNSYTEISVSGRGVHIIVKGTVEAGVKRLLDGHKVEMYSTTRFFTWSGEQLLGTPGAIAARQEQITELFLRISPPTPVIDTSQASASIATEADDQALLERALQDEKFARLMAGDTSEYGGDESRADLALVRKLAFYTGNDRDRIDRLFRQSGLMRPKWDEKRGAKTYGRITIEKVCGAPTVHTKPPLWTTLAAAVMP